MKISKAYLTTEDRLNLSGILYVPDGKKGFFQLRKNNCKEAVIFIHGMYSNCLRKRDDIFAEKLTENNITYFTFNNRGSDMGNMNKDVLYGTAFEDPRDCIKDIEAAIDTIKEMGFEKIHILGHSLGSSKILYWYQQKKHKVDSVGLLSLTSLSDKYRQLAGEKAYRIALGFAKAKSAAGKGLNILAKEFYPKPISADTFLSLFDEKSDFNYAFYDDNEWRAEELNSIQEPLFMRFGTENETITKSAPETVEFIKTRLKNEELDIGYISGANHSYAGKEEVLINEYVNFLKSITKKHY